MWVKPLLPSINPLLKNNYVNTPFTICAFVTGIHKVLEWQEKAQPASSSSIVEPTY